jgi:hypothetical protein
MHQYIFNTWQLHNSSGEVGTSSYLGGPDSVPGDFMWDWGLTKWLLNSFLSQTSLVFPW